MNSNKIYLYYILNKLDANAIYIGITSNHKIRWRQHCNACKFAKGSNKRLYNAINKYGVENFEMKVMEEFENRDDANQREIFLIQDFRNKNYKVYNVSNGGEGRTGVKVTYENKVKLSKMWRGENSNFSKLNKDQVNEIRSMFNTGNYNKPQLAKKFNVHTSTIRSIILEKSWTNKLHSEYEPKYVFLSEEEMKKRNILIHEEYILHKKYIEEIAKKFKLTNTSIRNILHDVISEEAMYKKRKNARKNNKSASQGSLNGHSKITEDRVLELIKLKGLYTQEEIAEKMQISIFMIASILSGKTWSHLTGIIYQSSYKRISEEKSKEIYELYLTGLYSYRELGRKFNADKQTIKNICSKLSEKEKN